MASKTEMPTLETMIEWLQDWEEATSQPRFDSRRDRDYYDNKQIDEEMSKELELRHQPEVVFNVVGPKIDYVLGDEIERRTDVLALPRKPMREDDAKAMTDAIRAVCDERQQFDRAVSQAAENIFVEGMGAIAVEFCPGEGVDGRITQKRVPWDRTWHDPHSREPDYCDAKYLGTVTRFDLDDAVDIYSQKANVEPNFEELLQTTLTEHAVTTDQITADKPTCWADRKRKRVWAIECYFRVGYDWYQAHFVRAGFLIKPRPTGYLDEDGHSECPLLLGSAYVSAECARYGIPRRMISPQDIINKTYSKAVRELSVSGAVAEEGAVSDKQAFLIERAKPDGFAIVNNGALANGKIQLTNPADLAQGQLALKSEAHAYCDTVAPSAQTMASDSQDSGRALQIAQSAANRQLAMPFDHLRDLKYRVYKATWNRIRQFKTREWWARIRDDKEKTGFRWVGLNKPTTYGGRVKELLDAGAPLESALAAVGAEDPEGMIMPLAQQVAAEMGRAGAQQAPDEQAIMAEVTKRLLASDAARQPFVANDVSKIDVDIVLDEQPDTAVIEQEEFNQLISIAPAFAQAGKPIPLDIIIRASQLRSKREILEQLDAKPDDVQTQLQSRASMANVAQLEANVGLTQATTVKTQAQTQEAMANAAKSAAIADTQPAVAQHHMGTALYDAVESGRRSVPDTTPQR